MLFRSIKQQLQSCKGLNETVTKIYLTSSRNLTSSHQDPAELKAPYLGAHFLKNITVIEPADGTEIPKDAYTMKISVTGSERADSQLTVKSYKFQSLVLNGEKIVCDATAMLSKTLSSAK